MPVYALEDDILFPPPELAREDGLLAVGGDLSPERLLTAYAMGIFPWYSEGEPILWWSPDPRMVLMTSEFHVSRRLARTMRAGKFEISVDTAFETVIEHCATVEGRGEGRTWITHEMRMAYTLLHRMGFAHSFECRLEGDVVGGLYGISLGRCFFGESMFSRVTDASKVATHALTEFARAHEFTFIDCQVANRHLASLGARDVPRPYFLELLRRAMDHETLRGSWSDWNPSDSL
ncbi:MAG: leucyl/phenylalanyl-tRNA--protein transferase [Candidatus Hydrogenedentota bacterium]